MKMNKDNLKKIILRADDLGYSKGVNYGIKKCVEKGTIRTVGFIVNLEDSLHGYNLLKDYKICLGLHVNITCGKPISDPNSVPSLTKKSGDFRSSKEYSHDISFGEVYNEINKQYDRFVQITKRFPDYMEGHAILNKTYLTAIKRVAEEKKVLFIPSLTSPYSYIEIRGIKTFFWLESMKENYDPSQILDKVFNINREGCEVIIFHPGFIDDALMKKSSLLLPRVKEVGYLTSNELCTQIKNNPEVFITYWDL